MRIWKINYIKKKRIDFSTLKSFFHVPYMGCGGVVRMIVYDQFRQRIISLITWNGKGKLRDILHEQ